MYPLYNYFELLGVYKDQEIIKQNINYCLRYMKGSYTYHNDIKNTTFKDILQFIKNIHTLILEENKNVK
jgi:hypothetical protein